MWATDSYTILKEIENVQPLAKGHTEKTKKPQTHQPLAAGVQVHALASSEAELQEGRYWLLLPLGNTEDRLKSRGKKVISQLVRPEQEKVPDTNKLINVESS